MKNFLYPAILIVLGFLVWAGTKDVPFQFDDDHVIVNNPDLRNPGVFLNAETWFAFHGRVLSYFGFMADYQLYGMDASGYHWLNIIIHILSAISVYFLFLLIGKTGTDPPANHLRIAALGGALFFLLHPMQTESVTYISQRMTSQAGMFLLWAYFFYLKFRTGHDKRILNLSLFVLLTILSFVSKQIALNILPVILVTEGILFFPKTERRKGMFVLISIVLLFAAILTLVWLMGVETRDSQLLSRKDYFLSQFPVIIAYISRIVLPINLSVDYDVPVHTSLFQTPVLLSVAALLLISTGAWLLRKRNPLIALGFFIFFAALSLECSVFPIKDLMADHRIYIGMAGISIIVSALLLMIRSEKKIWILIAALSISLGIMTYSRNQVWKTEIALWEDAARKAPLKSRPWNNLGFAYYKNNDDDRSARALQKALSLNPADYSAWNNLGLVHYRQKKYFQAAGAFYRSFQINKHYLPAINNVGKILSDLRLYHHALYIYNYLLKIHPGQAEVLFNKAVCLEQMGDLDEATLLYQDLLHLRPEYSEAVYNLGVIAMNAGRDAEAELFFLRVIELNPAETDAMNNLACVYYRNGKKKEAVRLLKEVLLLDPDHPDASINLNYITLENDVK